MKQSTKQLNQFRNLVNKELNALKYHADSLKRLQAECPHTSATNGRCNICTRKFITEDYLSKQNPSRIAEKTMTNFQFIILSLFLFFKGWNITKDPSLRNKRTCRWDKVENIDWRYVVQMRKDTGIIVFYQNILNGEITSQKEYSSLKDFIKHSNI